MTRKSRIAILALPLILAGAGSSVDAAVLASYMFSGGSTSSNDTDPNSTAGGFTITDGGTSVSGKGVSGSTNMAFFHTDSLSTSAAVALSAPDYMTFTITPTGGSTLNLTSLTFQFGGSNNGTGDFTTNGFLRTDAEAVDYSTNVGSEFSHVVAGPGGGSVMDLGDISIPLSGNDFTNVTTPVTFRLYVYSSENTGGKILRLDTLVLNGDLIPEPSSALLFGIGSLGLCLRRKRA